ncbi:hypothetical protein CL176_06370 [Suicoccus acidiformans]|uniref:Gram-positive cocci surface proteins LPxTG domain-containing protein n=1 Tax=Suicoccus acidiformans TaxID=2036206 RepID=A0A347WKP4_9LACT|nr:Ig-like domain-containing protein [Suicoccus acidiformans]AXY25651.1 hypothetical protein CL176_06370 [Suicoccus acidiformans]
MVGKNNTDLLLRKEGEKQQTYSIKKLNVGVASVAVAAWMTFSGSTIISAAEAELLYQSMGDADITSTVELSEDSLPEVTIEETTLSGYFESSEEPIHFDEAAEAEASMVEGSVAEATVDSADESPAVESPAAIGPAEEGSVVEDTSKEEPECEVGQDVSTIDNVDPVKSSSQAVAIESEESSVTSDAPVTASEASADLAEQAPADETVAPAPVLDEVQESRKAAAEPVLETRIVKENNQSFFEVMSDGLVKASLNEADLEVIERDGRFNIERPLTPGRVQIEAVNAHGATQRGFTIGEMSGVPLNASPFRALPLTNGQDVSNIVDAQGNLVVGDTLRGDGGFINFSMVVNVPESVNAGDYIELHYSPAISISQVNPNDRTNIDSSERIHDAALYGEYVQTVLDPNSLEEIAIIEDDRSNNKIRYTFTDYVDRHNNVSFSQNFFHNADLNEAPNSGNYNIYYTLGDKTLGSKNVYIDYSGFKRTSRNGNISVAAIWKEVVDGEKGQAVAYFNVDNHLPENHRYYLNFTPSIGGYTNTVDYNSLSYRIYRLSDGSVLPDSMAFDPNTVNALDVTNSINISRDASQGSISFTPQLSNRRATYVVVADVAMNPDAGNAQIVNAQAYNGVPEDSASITKATATQGGGGQGSGEVTTNGSFVETHQYIEYDGDGNVIFDSGKLPARDREVTNQPAGTSYTTGQQAREGFEFVRVTGTAPAIDTTNGSTQNGTIQANTILRADYVYEKHPVMEVGSFIETHRYIEYDAKNNIINDTGRIQALDRQKIDEPRGTTYTTSARPDGTIESPMTGYKFMSVSGNAHIDPVFGSQQTGEIPANETVRADYIYINQPAVEEDPLYEMTVEDISYETQFILAEDSTKPVGIREIQKGQDGRERVLYRHINPETIPNFTPDNFTNIRGQYYEEVSREIIQEAQAQIFEYTPRYITETIRNADNSITLVFNNREEMVIPPAEMGEVVPIIETSRSEGPLNPADAEAYHDNPGGYAGVTRPGTWILVQNPARDAKGHLIYNKADELEYTTERRFIPDAIDGEDGQNGQDGVEPIVQVSEGREIEADPNSRLGTWVLVRTPRRDAQGNLVKDEAGQQFYDEQREFIPDGQDGKSPTASVKDNGDGTHTVGVTNPDGSQTTTIIRDGKDGHDGLTPQVEATPGTEDPNDPESRVGTWVIIRNPQRDADGNPIRDVDGNLVYDNTREFIPDGQDGKSATASVVDNGDGTHIVTITNPDGTETTTTIRDGKDGHDGLTPQVEATPGTEDPNDPESRVGTWVIIRNPQRDADGNPIRDVDGNLVYDNTREFIPDGQDGESATASVEDNGDGTHTVTITNPDGTKTKTTIRDGKDGEKGQDGRDGLTPQVEVTPGTEDPNDSNSRVGTWVIIRNPQRDADGNPIRDVDGNLVYDITREFIPDGQDGKSATASVLDNGDGTHIVTITNPDGTETTTTIRDGKDGRDGLTPQVEVTSGTEDPNNPESRAGTWVIIRTPQRDTNGDPIRDKEGNLVYDITREFVPDGQDGKSATASVINNGDGTHTVTITNPDGTETMTIIRDGKDGEKGQDGRDGLTPQVEVTPGAEDPNDPESRAGTWVIIRNPQRYADGNPIRDVDGNLVYDITREFIPDGQDGKSATASVVDNGDGTHTVTITNPDGTETTTTIRDGKDGRDGLTPQVEVTPGTEEPNDPNSRTGSWVIIRNPQRDSEGNPIRDVDGNLVYDITRKFIPDGQDGESATASVVDNGNGTHTVTITNPDGTETTTTIRDGKDGRNGKDGRDGLTPIVHAEAGFEDPTDLTSRKGVWLEIHNPQKDGNGDPIRDADGNLVYEIERIFVAEGEDGQDGESPTAEVIAIGDGSHTLIVTNPDGSKTETIIHDGQDGNYVEVIDNGDGSFEVIVRDGQTQAEVSRYTVRNGQDGLSITAQTERGELGGCTGTWVNIYEMHPDRRRGALLDREFIFDGQDGESPQNGNDSGIHNENANINTNEQGDVIITIDGKDPIIIPNPDRTEYPIDNVRIDELGNLIIVLSDGRQINAGNIRPVPNEDGLQIVSTTKDADGNTVLNLSDGSHIVIPTPTPSTNAQNITVNINIIQDSERDLASAVIDNRGHLLLTYTDGETVDLGRVTAEPSPAGRSIASTIVNNQNELIIVYTDGSIENAGTIQVKDGTDGKSAYEIWLEAGNNGSIQDFLESLKAPNDPSDSSNRFVEKITVNESGDLVVHYTDQTEQTIHNYPSAVDNTNSVKDARVDQNGHLIITLENGRQIDAGNVRGPEGAPGKDGRSIANIRLDDNGNVIVVYNDFSVDIVGQLNCCKTPNPPAPNEPDTPGEPENPDTPDSNDPNEPNKPTDPNTPTDPNKPVDLGQPSNPNNGDGSNIPPSPTDPVQPGKHTPNQPIGGGTGTTGGTPVNIPTPVSANAGRAQHIVNSSNYQSQSAKELPNTGESDERTIYTGVAATLILTSLALVASIKRKEDEA